MTETDTGYKTDARIRWYRSQIDKDVLRELMQSRNGPALRQVCCQLGLYALTGGLAYAAFLNVNVETWPWAVPLLLLALFVHGTQGPFVGLVAVHELCHKTPFKTKAWNEFFLKVYAFISWSDPVWFRNSHIKHHQLTVHHDYDGEVVLPQDLGLSNWRFWLERLAWNPKVTWMNLRTYWCRATGQAKDRWYQHVLPSSNPALQAKGRRWARTLLIGHAVLAALFILSGHWFLIVVFTFGAHYCSWLGMLCGMPQHYGMVPDVDDFRLCCRSYTCSWLPAFLYWNMQYHVEHHMYPAVPFYNLPKLRAALAHDLPPAPHGLLATWKGMLAIYERRKTEPDYVTVPELPSVDGDHADDTTLEKEAALAV